MPMLANFVIIFSIYLLGNFTPKLPILDGRFEIVQFVGQLIATIVPNLENLRHPSRHLQRRRGGGPRGRKEQVRHHLRP